MTRGEMSAMTAIAVVGANWGDEGKGKFVDYLAAHADFVVRFQGGNNAGHTIINPFGKFALHLLPSGVFYSGVKNVIGPGVALNIRGLLQELENLRQHNVPEPQLLISDRAQVLLPVHRLLDQAEEELLGPHQFGPLVPALPLSMPIRRQRWASRSQTCFGKTGCASD